MQGHPPDWQDFVGIMALLIINSTISFIEENNAGNAAAALMAGLAPKTKVTVLDNVATIISIRNTLSLCEVVNSYACLIACRFWEMEDGQSKMLQSWYQEMWLVSS